MCSNPGHGNRIGIGVNADEHIECLRVFDVGVVEGMILCVALSKVGGNEAKFVDVMALCKSAGGLPMYIYPADLVCSPAPITLETCDLS